MTWHRWPAFRVMVTWRSMAAREAGSVRAAQSDSQVWIGRFNWEAWEFVDEGTLYNLPRNDACQVTYCNIGAVQWLDDRRITLASGVALPGDPWPCFAKSESLHQMLLPASAARPVTSSS